MEKVLKSYIRKLTNLSSANKSLFFSKTTEQELDLHRLDYAYKKSSFHIIESLIQLNSRIFLCNEFDSRNEGINRISGTLKNILRKDKEVFEERGTKDLIVGWPFAEGKFIDGSVVKCPLLYFPVELLLEEGKWYLKVKEEAVISFNKTFLIAYAHYNQVRVSETLLDTLWEKSNCDSLEFRTGLYELLKHNFSAINFNQDLFLNKLCHFTDLKKTEAIFKFHQGEIKLNSVAVLGVFPQSNSSLTADYEYLIENNFFEGFKDFFNAHTLNTPVHTTNNSNKEEHMITAFPIDGPQESALIQIKSGKSLVVQGPPGTGKSQLICNVICDFVAKGKKVLIVCQKKAALEVVFERLKEKKIDPYAEMIYDIKNDRSLIYKKISDQIDNIEVYKIANNTLNAIKLDREFLQTCREMDTILQELTSFKNALLDSSMFGISIKELYLTVNSNKPKIVINEECRYFNIESLHKSSVALTVYAKYFNKLKEADHWQERVNFSNFNLRDKVAINNLLMSIPIFWKEKQRELSEIVQRNLNINDCIEYNNKKEYFSSFKHLLSTDDIFNYFKNIQLHSRKKEQLLHLTEEFRKIQSKGEIKDLILHDPIEVLIGDTQEALLAFNNTFSKLYWYLFSKSKKRVLNLIYVCNLKLDIKSLKKLKCFLLQHKGLMRLIEKILSEGWHFPNSVINGQSLEQWLKEQQLAFELVEIYNHLNIASTNHLYNCSRYTFLNIIHSFISIVAQVSEKAENWRKYLTEIQENNLLETVNSAEVFTSQLESYFDLMVEADRHFDSLTNLQKSLFLKFNVLGLTPEEVGYFVEQAIKAKWIEVIEEANPVLRSVSTLKYHEMETRLQLLFLQKEKLSKEILLLRLSEMPYKVIEYNRLLNPVTYRDLKHQVGKKKRIWPIRKTFDNFSKDIFNLVPVWLTSPEAATSVFPMEQIFDLVIFDEASQCFAEFGIPCIYRAHQVVIVGDSQQLKPYNIYNTRYNDADENEEVETDQEIDSLLDLGLKYLPQVFLTEHYRSQSASLIDFSNIHFYNNKLKFLPFLSLLNTNSKPIEYIKVNGSWSSNCNREEADAVVRLLVELVEQHQASIGIVTFNYKQCQLIKDKLEEVAIKGGVLLPSTIFVKNIENVQGDERDIIIFSLGYAPNESGKLVMQFGSLNMEGGENRLNVAITRARKKIYLITSIYPEELSVEETKNSGPKLLKKYLEYSYHVSHNKEFRIIPPKNFAPNWYLSGKLKNFILNQNEVLQDLSYVDLTIKKKEEYIACILTDDENYFQRSVKDFHILMPLQLKEKKWPFEKVFSRQFYNDPSIILKVIDRISQGS